MLALLFSIICLGTTSSGQTTQQKSAGTVHVVLCVDTETRRLLSNHRVQALDLSDFAEGGDVDSAMAPDFRSRFSDSFGGHPKFTWFALTHQAFFVANPPKPLVIFDALRAYQDRMVKCDDLVGWHYHHSLWPKADSSCCWDQITTFNGTMYGGITDIEAADQMLAMLILRERFYPTVFRSGWIWENNDFSRWLESVSPFDFSNAAPLKSRDVDSIEQSVGAAYDWSRAPSDWTYYHPSDSDYQTPGNMGRIIFRCLPGHRSGDINFARAFARAYSGSNEIVAVYTHSFNSLNKLCNVTSSALRNASSLYPSVKFKYVNALEGARAALGYHDTIPPLLTIEKRKGMLLVTSDEPLFAPPVGAYADFSGRFRRAYAMDKVGQKGKSRHWEWHFDLKNVLFAEFAAGGCDSSGNGAVTPIITP